jgi:hypothetical protein
MKGGKAADDRIAVMSGVSGAQAMPYFSENRRPWLAVEKKKGADRLRSVAQKT